MLMHFAPLDAGTPLWSMSMWSRETIDMHEHVEILQWMHD
jgi:hypothetical protein